mmetsp:Transcript_28071/g.89345  ORF Transcript_28071/g.89345 Transcript_28071/m.89345 type:complete len:377 (-) Transcript_28071:398-1528(-)
MDVPLSLERPHTPGACNREHPSCSSHHLRTREQLAARMLVPLAVAADTYNVPCRSVVLGNAPLEVPFKARAGVQPLCFAVPELEGGRFTVSARAARLGDEPDSHICLGSRWSDDGRSTPARTDCANGAEFASVSRTTDTTRLCTVLPFDDSAVSSDLEIIVTVAVSRPGGAHSSPASERPLRAARGDYCAIERSNLLVRCELPAAELCPHAATDIDVMNCLSSAATGPERRLIDAGCEYAMREWSDCIYGPRLLVPMEIASFLLLAAASTILVCAIVRCCCRFLCFRIRTRRELNGSRAESLVDPESDGEADEETAAEVGLEPLQASSAPIRNGGGSSIKAAREADTLEAEAAEDDEALPTYSDVVDGATVRPRDA